MPSHPWDTQHVIAEWLSNMHRSLPSASFSPLPSLSGPVFSKQNLQCHGYQQAELGTFEPFVSVLGDIISLQYLFHFANSAFPRTRAAGGESDFEGTLKIVSFGFSLQWQLKLSHENPGELVFKLSILSPALTNELWHARCALQSKEHLCIYMEVRQFQEENSRWPQSRLCPYWLRIFVAQTLPPVILTLQ